KTRTRKNRRVFRHLTLHTKIAIVATLILIFGGAALVFACEYNNPQTIANLSLFDKLQVSFFQSITTRTAGFASIPQENLMGATSIVSIVLMIIGGSPVGTAGGIKTVTVAVLLCSAFSTIKGKNDASLFGRRVSSDSIRKAVAVVTMFSAVMIISTVLLSALSDAPVIDVIYECVSATATVGLSRGFTGTLNMAGKLVVIATMYFGRIGPISLAIALGGKNENRNIVSDPIEEISIG
ncbi:MAG: potassium transporter KtrB, partial [Ruminococcaceae bacterium]|nr:potassium transporter KtrB [Oscillospiraceae bacterium]